jgi:ribosomal-protein-alanine N-acetyltransferase
MRASELLSPVVELGGLGEVEFRPPEIKTDRLVLRGWEPEDIESVYLFASDPEVARYMSWSRHESSDQSSFFLDNIVADEYRRGEYSYAVCHKDSLSRAIGGVGVSWEMREHGVMELGYVLRRQDWGHGYITEACQGLLHRAFSDFPVEHIFAPVFSKNARSRRVCEKLGFRLDGVRRGLRQRAGQRLDLAYYSMLRDERESSGVTS